MTEKEKKLKAKLGVGWYEALGKEFEKPYMQTLGVWLASQRKEVYIFPSADEMFTAFRLTQPQDVKVVILGQDPYPSTNTAHGLAFSSKDPLYFPPTLNTILSEIESDVYNGLQLGLFESPDLTRWATQGVFLLNTILTVEKDKPLSHEGKGWELFTEEVIRELNNQNRPVVWMLWGEEIQRIYRSAVKISNNQHLILQAPHPDEEDFKRCMNYKSFKQFSAANEYLKQHGIKEIIW